MTKRSSHPLAHLQRERRAPTRAARTWLFDLDDTLHDASAYLFPRINRAMTAYIVERLGIDEAEATRLRQIYWRRYGATLQGLMRHHGVDPDHFLRHTHAFPDLARHVFTERGLKHMLRRLPGRKILFSNAPLAYAQAVLDAAGIRRCFDALYSIERLRYRPKPARAAYLTVLRRERLNPRRCIFVEDSLANLIIARRLGMKTVWINAGTRQPLGVDVKLRSVLGLPARWRRL